MKKDMFLEMLIIAIVILGVTLVGWLTFECFWYKAARAAHIKFAEENALLEVEEKTRMLCEKMHEVFKSIEQSQRDIKNLQHTLDKIKKISREGL
jgi:hypothetical protein